MKFANNVNFPQIYTHGKHTHLLGFEGVGLQSLWDCNPTPLKYPPGLIYSSIKNTLKSAFEVN